MRALPLLLLFFAFAAASADDVPEPEGFWSGPINSAVPATIEGGKVIHTKELADLLKQTKPLVIDVSNEPKRPAGMAPDVVKRLNETLVAVLNDPALREKLSVEAVEPWPMTPEQFGQYVRSDIQRWSSLAKTRKIQLDE